MAEIALPLVDLSSFIGGDAAARANVAREFTKAFETVGFAVVVGHGIPEPLIDETYAAMTAFFDASFEAKSAYTPPEKAKGRGYLPMGIESVGKTLAGETPPDLCEALVFGAPHREGRPGHRPNFYPEQPPELAGLVKRYSAEILKLNAHLVQLMALALDMEEDALDPLHTDPALTLRFVNYPDQVEEPKPGQLRYGEHHDYGTLTILRQDAAPGGLEIRDFDGVWKEATVVPGSFVINVGDLLARWTNDRWRSTLHRVSNPPRGLTGSTKRLSMVAFTGPNEDAEITVLPTCRSEDAPAKYPPVKAGEYILSKIAASHEIKAD
ncbi:isopenicillin N synthase family oxygenase [Jiella endophytica]|uniref:2-oxoglutarate-dependent ethylene/succinate-forming enzyme n=1 Tax=Jiella endophytica TaxID=2558362 RepID=A0A4Y8RKE9_9HYPH|nr:2-oxoglutarate and iron-dependent oxygenase domain-containing protein [Jiella endophytica]TFF23227.1 isopenicillin N synthase family oxygenase [Jiella endophytica]